MIGCCRSIPINTDDTETDARCPSVSQNLSIHARRYLEELGSSPVIRRRRLILGNINPDKQSSSLLILTSHHLQQKNEKQVP